MRRSLLEGRSHRPAHRLAELRAEIARNREEAVIPRRIQHRQLAALQRVLGVGQDLVHHLQERIAAGDQQPLLAIGRETHVVGGERRRLGDRDRLLAATLHVEAGLALALGPIHPLVEGACQHHRAKSAPQRVRGQIGRPGADRAPFVVQHPDQSIGQIADFGVIHIHGRPRNLAGRRQPEVSEVEHLARARLGFRNPQAERVGPKRGRRCGQEMSPEFPRGWYHHRFGKNRHVMPGFLTNLI